MQIIAHRGACGDRPEHTLAGYALAIEQGADIIEPDLLFSADGVLVCRHDWGLRRSTDIAERRSLAAEQDVAVADLSLAELRELRCIQPWPQRDHAFDGRYGIVTFAELLDLLAAESARRGRRLLVYPEAKHPAEHAARGLDFQTALLTEFQRRGWSGPQSPVWLQCFDHAVLRQLKRATGMHAFALVDVDDAVNLAELAVWADGLGVSKRRLLDAEGRPSAFTREALQLGLQLHAWTVRHDVPDPRFPDTAAELEALRAAGIHACFCDFPGRALADLR
jgi:glycerophosphoryl diester phosphodiesterase